MPTLLQELDKAIEDKQIDMFVEHDVTNDIYKIYLRDNINKTEHLYTKIGLRRYLKPIDDYIQPCGWSDDEARWDDRPDKID